jgi:hypothetical protein
MHDLLDMGASSVKNSRSPNCSWRNCVVGQRRPQIDARQVLGADQSGIAVGIDRMLGATTSPPSLIRADEELKMAI